MISKKLALAGTLVLTAISVASVSLWLNGWLYLRVPSAKTTLNGKASVDSKIYKGASGDYFVFLENDKAEFPVYRVFPQNEEVGVPNSVPSISTKSLKTNWFLLCKDCEVVVAGTVKLDRNATVSVTSKGLEFKVSGDEVVVQF